MEPRDQKQNTGHVLDQLLDSALAQYSKVDPRAGLESRTNANLQSERDRIAATRRWWWALTLAATTAVIILTVWIESNTGFRGKVPVAMKATPEQPADTKKATIDMQAQPHVSQGTCEINSRPENKRRSVHKVETPRLDRFPSPRPLSEQERLLLGYVNQTPREEVVLAVAKTKSTEDLHVKALEIPPLGGDRTASELSERN